jgi:hypothetical protein
MTMSFGFWLGLLLAIPIGIATNLATRPIQNWLDRRSSSASIRLAKRAQKRLVKAEAARRRIYKTAATMAVLGVLALSSLVFMLYAFAALNFMGADSDAVFPWTSVPPRDVPRAISHTTALFSSMLSALAAFLLFLNEASTLRDIDIIDELRSRATLLEEAESPPKLASKSA